MRANTPDPTGVVRRGKTTNWMMSHWRGDLSLPVSYWVIGFLLSIAVGVAAVVFGTATQQSDMPPRVSGFAILAIFGIAALLTIWQIVGTWRSASKHVSRGGSAFWAGAAKVALVLGTIKAVGDFQKEFPMIEEGAHLALGIDRIPPHAIRILADGKEIELSGGIDWGTTDAIAEALNQNPEIKVIHLNSIGGRISEAQSLHDFIQVRNLTTYTSSECSSACTLAYLGGDERYIGEGGKIGFHSTAIVGDDKPFSLLNAEMASFYRSHGLSDAFVDKALAVEPADMWYPTHDELISAKVISAIVDSRYYGMSGIRDWSDAYKVEQGLLEIEAFATLKEHDPATYSRMKDIFVDGVKAGRPQFEVTQEIRTIFMAEVVPQYIKQAPDKELIDYWNIQMEEARSIASQSAKQCVQFLGVRTYDTPLDIQKILPADLLARDLTSLATLMKSTIRDPQVPESIEEYEAAFFIVVAKLAEIDSEYVEALVTMKAYQGPDEMLCAATISLYDAILGLPDDMHPAGMIRAMVNSI